MKARGKEIYIIAGVIAAVVCAAWYFLLFNPVRSQVSDLDAQIEQNEQTIASTQQEIVRLESYKKTAPQAEAELVRLNKILPDQSGEPSYIIELVDTAKASGVGFESIKPGEIVQGTTFSVQPVDLKYSGRYFDLEDFLYRLESYVQYRNQSFLVTGRMLAVTDISLKETNSEQGFPYLDAEISVNAYQWAASSAGASAPAAVGSTTGTASTQAAASTVGVQ